MIKDIINIGNNVFVIGREIRGVTGYDTTPRRAELNFYRQENRVTDATRGRKIRSLIQTKDGHIYISTLTPDTVKNRMLEKEDA